MSLSMLSLARHFGNLLQMRRRPRGGGLTVPATLRFNFARPFGYALYQPRCVPRLSSRAERPPKQGKVAADRNRLVFHLTGCLVSADCCPLTSEPLRRPGCQQAADGSLGIPQFTSWTGPRLGESSATYLIHTRVSQKRVPTPPTLERFAPPLIPGAKLASVVETQLRKILSVL